MNHMDIKSKREEIDNVWNNASTTAQVTIFDDVESMVRKADAAKLREIAHELLDVIGAMQSRSSYQPSMEFVYATPPEELMSGE